MQVISLEVASWLIPMTTILPKPFLRQIIWSLSWFDHLIYEDLRETYDGPLFDYAFDYLSTANHTIDNMLFIGHSLGGVMAQIVASQLYGLQKQDISFLNDSVIKSFGFSSPGLLLSARKFNVNIDDLVQTATILKAEHDFLAAVDSQVGLVQDLKCVFANQIWGCHRMQNAVCTLNDQCPNDLSHHPQLVSLYCEYVADYPGYNMLHVWQNHVRNDSSNDFCYECDRVELF